MSDEVALVTELVNPEPLLLGQMVPISLWIPTLSSTGRLRTQLLIKGTLFNADYELSMELTPNQYNSYSDALSKMHYFLHKVVSQLSQTLEGHFKQRDQQKKQN